MIRTVALKHGLRSYIVQRSFYRMPQGSWQAYVSPESIAERAKILQLEE